MKTLHLVVDRKHLERIVSEKCTDYRKVKPYYQSRLSEDKQYDRVCFRNGYRKDAPTVIYEFKGFRIWNDLYQLFLGNLISCNDSANDIIDQVVQRMLEKSVNQIL